MLEIDSLSKHFGGLVAVGLPEAVQARPHGSHRRDLGLVPVVAAGVAEVGIEAVEVPDGGERVDAVPAQARVDEPGGGCERHLSVRGECHFDSCRWESVLSRA